MHKKLVLNTSSMIAASLTRAPSFKYPLSNVGTSRVALAKSTLSMIMLLMGTCSTMGVGINTLGDDKGHGEFPGQHQDHTIATCRVNTKPAQFQQVTIVLPKCCEIESLFSVKRLACIRVKLLVKRKVPTT